MVLTYRGEQHYCQTQNLWMPNGTTTKNRGRWGSLIIRILLPFCRFLLNFARNLVGLFQPLQHGSDNDRQPHGRIDKDFSELPAFRRRNELAPRDRLAVGTARESAPVDRLGANPQAVVITLQGHVFSQPPVAQFDVRPELLRPVARHSA